MLNYQSTGCIYRITCTTTRQNYIGQTVNTQQRWATHIADLRKGKHHSHKLQEAFWKYGESCLKFEILESGIDTQDMLNREAHWMKVHEGYGAGFNIQYVGHPNGKPTVQITPRKSKPLAQPPLTIVKNEKPQPKVAEAIYKGVELGLDGLRDSVIEMLTRQRVALEEAAKLRKENEILIRDNAVLRWRLGERSTELIEIA